MLTLAAVMLDLCWQWFAFVCRLEDLVPADAWDHLETGRLHRASQDSAYRDEVLRANGLVSPQEFLGL